jgi:hypothetical protein
MKKKLIGMILHKIKKISVLSEIDVELLKEDEENELFTDIMNYRQEYFKREF